MGLLSLFKQAFKGQKLTIDNLDDLKDILYSKNKNAVKEIIISENKHIGTNLRMISIELSEAGDKTMRREISKCFMDCLMEVKSSHPQALVWLKRHVDFDICAIILSDCNYSGNLIQVTEDKAFALKERIENNLAKFIMNTCDKFTVMWLKISYNGLLRIIMIAMAYLDLCLDSILLCTIVSVLGATLDRPKLFSTQIAILLFVSIVLPLLITSVSIAYKMPLTVLSSDNWVKWKISNVSDTRKTLMFLRISIICLFPIVPAMILFSNQKAREQRQALKKKNQQNETSNQVSVLKECELLTRYIEETKLAILAYKRNELSIELVTQLSIHVTMVILSQTDYPVESGLQSIFQSSNNGKEQSNTTLVFLILSVLWSFKTTALTNIAIKAGSKNFLPMIPKIILGIRYLFIFLVRIGCIVSFFAPYIGVLGIMNHHIAENIPLDFETFKNINQTSEQQFQYWNPIEEEFQSIDVHKLFRSDYTDTDFPEAPPTTHYTVISLNTAFLIFLAMYLLYAVIVFSIKQWMNKDFRLATFEEKLQHVLQTLNMPEAFGDWDTDGALDLRAHLKKWRNVLVEMLIMILIQLLINMTMMVPFLVTGKKVLLLVCS